jgi:hypothetical protein
LFTEPEFVISDEVDDDWSLDATLGKAKGTSEGGIECFWPDGHICRIKDEVRPRYGLEVGVVLNKAAPDLISSSATAHWLEFSISIASDIGLL